MVKKQSGFTFVEISAVLVIIGVLGSVVVQKFYLVTDTASEQTHNLKWLA